MKRAFLVIAVLAVLAAQNVALAAWLITGTGHATEIATVLNPPTVPSAVATSGTTVSISWAAPTTGPAPTSYAVYRNGTTLLAGCTALSCNDTGLSPGASYSYAIVAQLGSWTRQVVATVTTPDVARAFTLSPIANQTAGTAFTVSITALAGGATDVAYNGTKTVLFSGPANSPNGTAPTYPATVNFTAGAGTATITLVKAETVSLTATEGPRTGSRSVTVTGGPGVLSFTSSTPSCTTGSLIIGVNNGSFVSKVTRGLDAFGNPGSTASDLTVTITLAQTPTQTQQNKIVTVTPSTVTIGAGATESTLSFSVNYPNGLGNTSVLVTATAGTLSTACQTSRT